MYDPDAATFSSEAVAGCISDLCHVLGVEQTKVNRLTITPNAGMVQAEVWLDETEPVYGPSGSHRRKVDLKGWSYPLTA